MDNVYIINGVVVSDDGRNVRYHTRCPYCGYVDMRISKVELLIHDWYELSQNDDPIDLKEAQRIAKDTYELLNEYAPQNLIPKPVANLLVVMEWFVSGQHYLLYSENDKYYKDMVSIISKLTRTFFENNFENSDVCDFIEGLINNN